MRTARASIRVPGRVGEAEALWYDTRRWAGWVEGFKAVVRADGEWPRVGSEVIWDSTPDGRGRVRERVVAYEPRAGQTVEVEDQQLTGQQVIAFGVRPDDDIDIDLVLSYRLKSGGPFMFVTDALFIRRALRDSLRRTLQRFARELAAERELLRG